MGSVDNVFVNGSISVVCSNSEPYSIYLFDISNKLEPPKLKSRVEEKNEIEFAVIHGDTLFVNRIYYDLRIYDVTNVSNPIFITEITNYGSLNDIFLGENYVYVALGDSGFEILDFSKNISDPTSVGYENTETDSVYVQGNHAHICEKNYGYKVINVTDKSDPVEIYQLEIDDDCLDVVARGNYAFVTVEGIKGVIVFDISDILSPVRLDDMNGLPSEIPSSVFVDEDSSLLFYSGSSSHYIWIYNITDITTAVEISRIATTYLCENLFYSDDYLWVADKFDGLKIYDLSVISQPILSTRTENYGLSAKRIVVDDVFGYAFVKDHQLGIKIYDVGKTTISFVSDIPIEGLGNFQVFDNYLYCSQRVNDESFLSIYKWYQSSNLFEHELICCFPINTYAGYRGFNVNEEQTFISFASGPDGLTIYNITNKSNPENYSSYEGMAESEFQIELVVANNPEFRPKLEEEETFIDDFEWLKPLVEKCWDHDPLVRYTCKEVRQILQKKGSIESHEKGKMFEEEEQTPEEPESKESKKRKAFEDKTVGDFEKLKACELEIESLKDEIRKLNERNKELEKCELENRSLRKELKRIKN